MTTAPYPFTARHIGPGVDDTRAMLATIGVPSIETLISQAVPKSIRLERPLDLPAAASEAEALAELSATMAKNTVLKSFIGAGYHGVNVPPVIQRNLFENPAWYTAYTPYQAEISQGRLELLFHFQTLVTELTGLPVASASLLDEATAVAEAIGIAWRFHYGKRPKIVIAGSLHPQILDVVKTRAEPLGIQVVEGEEADEQTAAVIVPWPDTFGVFGDYSGVVDKATAAGAVVIAVADPLALALLEAPGKQGADIVVGSMQRFGVPMGFGGPHAAYLAVSDRLTRLIPGRLVGQSVDAHGRPGYRLALQTREQHIRRDKATSNICTAQALLANMAASYAIWHGSAGLQGIASRIHALANGLAEGLKAAGVKVLGANRFDTVTVEVTGKAAEIAAAAEKGGRLLRILDADHVGISFDETSTEADAVAIAALFGAKASASASSTMPGKPRGKDFLTQPVFHENRSETDMMRFLRRLADKDLALDRAMIPLGSCTMKLNAAAEMMPVSWSSVANLHPFAPKAHSLGYRAMIDELEGWLCEITGFDAVTLQPNAGSQGEYAGLLAIRGYHRANGNDHRNICLIPSSAHGTNPASAAMAGMSVVVVHCTEDGNIDIEDLKAKAASHATNLAALMFTYPSTHGVFEEGAKDICAIVHEHGGQVYFDGANLNALVGLARPGDIGADVCHMNLHKTFCIPHGGGGPGVGPIGVKAHLKPYLPGHVAEGSAHAVSAAPFGSASILPITWMYIRMMGAAGLKQATEVAILSANYLVARLGNHYSVLYRGRSGRVAHECILDTRVLKESSGITVDDIAKRLIDYGFHAPTMSFPVAGTLMVEPTESEPKREVDRLCEALISIACEADKVGKGEWPKDDNPLVNAPHTAAEALVGEWKHPYSRLEAAFPSGDANTGAKYWPPVSRIDNVAGDRNLVCSCPPMTEYLGAAE
ncbi:glycine dehydrogenase [Mesorhizobium sp. Root157]|uniref:aminomethyl-transferring glycine dehydrogenase n=1 Tax=Mesorhizobium sp. Root157 TaxID=1736477 RepID=UPI0006FA5B80|nr:aminomethyl-transferring glycine dehydrogenase [Mesorhizobium sp. Root157]KQZ78178.1 glycine dehydrogenase [Mesorhizobium sp. Root157]